MKISKTTQTRDDGLSGGRLASVASRQRCIATALLQSRARQRSCVTALKIVTTDRRTGAPGPGGVRGQEAVITNLAYKHAIQEFSCYWGVNRGAVRGTWRVELLLCCEDELFVVLSLFMCENRDGWLVAWGLCGFMLIRSPQCGFSLSLFCDYCLLCNEDVWVG